MPLAKVLEEWLISWRNYVILIVESKLTGTIDYLHAKDELFELVKVK